MGIALQHPNGGPVLSLRLDGPRAEASAGFDYFSVAVPDRMAIEDLAATLTDLGESHAGVHCATIGWILPGLHDPDGHDVRFYTQQEHTTLQTDQVRVIHDPRESAEAHATQVPRAGSPPLLR